MLRPATIVDWANIDKPTLILSFARTGAPMPAANAANAPAANSSLRFIVLSPVFMGKPMICTPTTRREKFVPSDPGARPPDKNTNTNIVAIYGDIDKYSTGISSPIA